MKFGSITLKKNIFLKVKKSKNLKKPKTKIEIEKKN